MGKLIKLKDAVGTYNQGLVRSTLLPLSQKSAFHFLDFLPLFPVCMV